MIDIHCHILPGLDDGPRSLEESIQMAKAGVAEGITTIIATPHFIPEVFNTDKDKVSLEVAKLQSTLDELNYPIKILSGMEIHLTLDIAKQLVMGKSLPLGDAGKYMLLELPISAVPSYANQVVFDLMLSGIRPIIAHPERNKEIATDPGILQGLIEKGCLVQVTSGSITGDFGSEVRCLTENFLRHGWVDFIASDAHHPTKRPLKLKEAWEIARELIGQKADKLVLGNPRSVIKGDPITKGDVLPYNWSSKNHRSPKRTFWSGLNTLFKTK